MLGDEVAEIDDGLGWLEAGVKGGAGKFGGRHSGDLFHDGETGIAEVFQNFGDPPIVVGGFVSFAVLEIGGVKCFSAAGVIVEALVPERFEVEEVAGVFLDRPFVIAAFGQDFAREAVDGGSEAVGGGAEAIENFGGCIGRETELEGAREPFAAHAAN